MLGRMLCPHNDRIPDLGDLAMDRAVPRNRGIVGPAGGEKGQYDEYSHTEKSAPVSMPMVRGERNATTECYLKSVPA